MTSSRHSPSSAEPRPSCCARHRPTAPMLKTPRRWRPASPSHSRRTSPSHGSVSAAPAGREMTQLQQHRWKEAEVTNVYGAYVAHTWT